MGVALDRDAILGSRMRVCVYVCRYIQVDRVYERE